ncbi:hypothetical protein [Streptomyces rochei]|uniref:hypothetical protein n=1 Tax=Streptomyces rochei TaxID=1928 RepID=UPI0033A003BF
MPLPQPFTLDGLIAGIEAERERRIKLVPIPSQLLARTDVCGLWLQLDHVPVDLILYMQGTTTFHRTQIILHELAHLWCGDATRVSSGELVRLLPQLPSEALRRLSRHESVRAQDRHESHVERRAEMLAGLLHHEAYSSRHIDDPVLRHLDEDLSRLPLPTRPRAVR